MYSLDLPADVIALIRNAARDADISAARTFGFGGSNWTVARPAGTGIGTRTLADAGTVQGLAFLQKPSPLTAEQSTPVLSEDWKFILLSGALKANDVITSVADSRYVFNIESLEPWYDYSKAMIVQRAATVTTAQGGWQSILWPVGL